VRESEGVGLKIKFKIVSKSRFLTSLDLDQHWGQGVTYPVGTLWVHSLGTSSGIPGQDTANTSQGNGQCTHQKPVQYITNTFRIFQANLIAVFPAQEMPSTSSVPSDVIVMF